MFFDTLLFIRSIDGKHYQSAFQKTTHLKSKFASILFASSDFSLYLQHTWKKAKTRKKWHVKKETE